MCICRKIISIQLLIAVLSLLSSAVTLHPCIPFGGGLLCNSALLEIQEIFQ